MGEPSKHAKEAVERIAQRLRWGFFGPADREAMSEIIDRAIQEAAKPLVEALEKISKMGIPTAIDINNQMDCARVYGEEKAARIAKEALHAIKGD